MHKAGSLQSAKKLTFHFNGDMGGIKNGMDQQLVAKGMEAAIDSLEDDDDVQNVYSNFEVSEEVLAKLSA